MGKKTKKKGKGRGAAALLAVGLCLASAPAMAGIGDYFTNGQFAVEASEPRLLAGYSVDSGFTDIGESVLFSYSPYALVYKNAKGRIVEFGVPALGGGTVAGNDATNDASPRFSYAVTFGVLEVLYPTVGWITDAPQDDGSTGTERQYLLLIDGVKGTAKAKELLGSLWGLTGL